MKDLLGFDIGGTKCAVIFGRESGDGVVLADRVEFPTTGGPEACLVRAEETAALLLERNGAGPLKGIGISCGGPLDSTRGLIQSPPNLPGWDNIPVTARFSRKFNAPARLQNDANACAVAEWKWGAGQGTRHMIFLTFGTGLGAGLILNGALYSGACDLGGEAGHIRLAEQGPVGYGKSGSFEGFCSGGGIARLAASLGFKPGGREATAKDVFLSARSGDPAALAIVETVGHQLGRGLAILIDTFNPERIVIGSIFARQHEWLRRPMEEALEREALPQSLRACEIVPARLGEQIGDYAALALACGQDD